MALGSFGAFKKKRQRGGGGKVSLNITPLIDINANLLFFLMISASVQEDRLEAGELVELPTSTSKKAEAGDLISVVIALESVSVNEIQILALDEGGQLPRKDFDAKRNRVKPLYKDLTTRFQELLEEGAQPGAKGDDDDKLPVVLVQADRRLPYRTLKAVMRTCGQAGFTRFRFAATEQQ